MDTNNDLPTLIPAAAPNMQPAAQPNPIVLTEEQLHIINAPINEGDPVAPATDDDMNIEPPAPQAQVPEEANDNGDQNPAEPPQPEMTEEDRQAAAEAQAIADATDEAIRQEAREAQAIADLADIQSRTEECAVCYEDKPLSEVLQMSCEEHWLCKEHIIETFERAVKSQADYPPQCCAVVGRIEIGIVDHWLPPALIKEYEQVQDEYHTDVRLRCYCGDEECKTFLSPDSYQDYAANTYADCRKCQKSTCVTCKSLVNKESPHECKKVVVNTTNEAYSNDLRFKACPFCGRFGQLDNACNHVTCLAPSCQGEWCFICVEAWNQGEGHEECQQYGDPTYDEEGYDQRGYHRDTGMNKEGFTRGGYNIQGRNRDGERMSNFAKRVAPGGGRRRGGGFRPPPGFAEIDNEDLVDGIMMQLIQEQALGMHDANANLETILQERLGQIGIRLDGRRLHGGGGGWGAAQGGGWADDGEEDDLDESEDEDDREDEEGDLDQDDQQGENGNDGHLPIADAADLPEGLPAGVGEGMGIRGGRGRGRGGRGRPRGARAGAARGDRGGFGGWLPGPAIVAGDAGGWGVEPAMNPAEHEQIEAHDNAQDAQGGAAPAPPGALVNDDDIIGLGDLEQEDAAEAAEDDVLPPWPQNQAPANVAAHPQANLQEDNLFGDDIDDDVAIAQTRQEEHAPRNDEDEPVQENAGPAPHQRQCDHGAWEQRIGVVVCSMCSETTAEARTYLACPDCQALTCIDCGMNYGVLLDVYWPGLDDGAEADVDTEEVFFEALDQALRGDEGDVDMID